MAPRAGKKSTLAKGRRLRVTRLDGCGRIQYGDYAQAVSTGFVSVSATVNTTETDEINVTNANGDPVIYDPSRTSFASVAVEIAFAEVDPEVFTLITGQRLVKDAFGNPSGFALSSKVDLSNQGYALEVWAGVTGSDACAGEVGIEYGYFLYPFLKGGVLGDHTIENGGITFTITGAVTQDGSNWGVGPYDVTYDEDGDPSPLLEALDPNEHELFDRIAYPYPEAFIGTKPLLDPEADAITSISGTPGTGGSSKVVTFAAVPDPDADTGVWYEFGDGTWDFVLGGDTTHTYETAGTYTVRASTNGSWVTTSVTVS
jgi:hypothetical protein